MSSKRNIFLLGVIVGVALIVGFFAFTNVTDDSSGVDRAVGEPESVRRFDEADDVTPQPNAQAGDAGVQDQAAVTPASGPWCNVEVEADGGMILWNDDGDMPILRRNGEWFATPDGATVVQINAPVDTSDQYVLRLWDGPESRDVACSFVALGQTLPPTVATAPPPVRVGNGGLVPVPQTGAYIGMNTGDAANGVTVDSQEALFGHEMAVERVFYAPDQWTESNINIDRIVSTFQEGRIPMVSYATPDWKAVASGQDDAIIDKLADQIKASGIPMLLTIDHEPDEEACLNSEPDCGLGQTSQDFVNMWQRVHDRFEAKDVDNVSWNWIVMGWQWSPNGNDERRQIIEDMFPGTDYVDWMSADLYNDAGGCSFTPEEINERWSSLETRGQGWYDWASQFGKPLALGEWGTFDDVLQDGRKAEWLRDAGETIKQWDNIKAVVYFDRFHEGCDWRLTTGGDVELAGYRDIIDDPYFIKG